MASEEYPPDWPRYEDGSLAGYKSCERCHRRTPYPWLNYSATPDDRLLCPACVVTVERQYRAEKAASAPDAD